MAVPRTRQRQLNVVSGTTKITPLGGGTPSSSMISAYAKNEITKDIVGSKDTINVFDLVRNEYSGSIVNYSSKTSLFRREVSNCPSGLYGASWAHLPVGSPSDDEITGRLKASGPLTPRVNLPLFVFELRDVPLMLKRAGELKFRLASRQISDPLAEAAAANLAYKFGWEPLISDILKMVQVGDMVKRKQDELTRAASSKGLRKKVSFGSQSASTMVAKHPLWRTFVSIDANVSQVTTHETWATCRWKIKPGQSMGGIPSYTDAFRTVYGLNRGHMPIALWKSLPWTWAIDWFADFSSALTASYNMLYYTPSGAARMDRITSTMQHSEIREGNLVVCTAGSYVKYTKLRKPLPLPSSNIPHLKLPFLDNFKLSILGSFTVLGLKRTAR